MFLWVDPNNPDRALLYMSTFENPDAPLKAPNIIVTDISDARQGIFKELTTFNVVNQYPSKLVHQQEVDVHSLSLNPQGTRAYVSVWSGQFLIFDTSDFAKGLPNPKLRLVTPIANRPVWPNAHTHSAVKFFGRPLVMTIEEVYGNYTTAFDLPKNTDGCPWGWERFIDISDETHPVVVGEYKLPENEQAFCSTPAGQDPANTDFTSFGTHNPTVLRDLAFDSWHSEGLQATDVTDPTHPTSAGFFSPQPLHSVTTDDPALGRGINKVIMWSYPIIKDGLIYVVDIRNGLYILRYTGPRAQEVSNIKFLEGNSNLGDAMTLGG